MTSQAASSSMEGLNSVPTDPLVASLADLSLSHDANPEKLCDVCSLLDFNKTFFGGTNYRLPATSHSLGLPNRICWSLYRLRRETECSFCKLVLEAVNLSKISDGLGDGIVAARRAPLYSKEKDAILSNLYFLSLLSSVNDINQSPVETGYVIGVSRKHDSLVVSRVDPELRDLYPYAPPGLIPFATQSQWKDRSGQLYEVSVRTLDPEKVDINLITGWLQKCEKEHATWCPRSSPSVDVIVGFRIIDVKIGAIVDAAPQCRYLALSYVWGKIYGEKHYLSLKKGNYQDLKNPGALFDSMKNLPETIKDAILLCQKLNERYLWIDSLCILQDSVEDKEGQIRKMDVIYKRALMTIVAAAGSDANAGLPGLCPNKKRISAPTVSIGSLDLVVLSADGESDVRQSKWNSRAWTFQERVLSSRILRFTSTSVIFECQEARWGEGLEINGPESDQFRLAENDKDEQEIRQNFHQIISDTGLYFEKMQPRQDYVNVFRSLFQGCYSPLVRDYTKRQLTYQDDSLNAFKGIEVALTRSLGPFCWGLPQQLLSQSLTWIARSSDHSRRLGFPSWSWAGWMFGDGGNASYTTTLHGPLPAFAIFSDEGSLSYWSSDWSKDPYIGIRLWHDLLLYPADFEEAKQREKNLNDTVNEVWNILDGIPLSSLLFFSTSAVPLEISSNERGSVLELQGVTVIRHEDNSIQVGGDPYEEEIEDILTKSETGNIELVYLGLDSMRSGSFVLILVEWVDKIAHRIHPQLLFSIDGEDWELAEPQRRLVVLA